MKFGLQRLAEGDRLGGDDVHQRPALQAREHRRIHLLGDLLVIAQDHAAARAAQRLVRGGGHDMRMRQRRRMRAAGDEAGNVRHVDHQIGADRVGDLAEALPVPDARIGGAAGKDQLRLGLVRLPFDLIHVEQMVVLAHTVGDDLEPLAAHVDRRAVRQVPARIEIEAHEGVARLEQREEHRLVHLAAGVRLDIGEVAVEQLLGAVDGQLLGDIHVLAAAVVALARIALGIFVGHDRALRFKHGARHDVLRSDQLDLVPLPAKFLADRTENFRIDIGKRR